MCFSSAPAVLEGMYCWWGANEVLWRWDSCCKVSPCSCALPGSLGWVVGEAMAGPFRHRRGPCLWFCWALGKPWGSRVLFLPESCAADGGSRTAAGQGWHYSLPWGLAISPATSGVR